MMIIFQIIIAFTGFHSRAFALAWGISSNTKKSKATSLISKARCTNSKREVTVVCAHTKHSHPMPDQLPKLKHSYYLLRHGQSLANVDGIISSDRSLARSTRHGLTELGREQGLLSAKNLVDLLEKQPLGNVDGHDGKKKRMFIYSSPFARAKETAEACIEGLRSLEQQHRLENLKIDIHPEIIIEDGFMERYFGRLDGDKLHTYSYVWPVDSFDVTHKAFDVESVAEVSARASEAILRIESSGLHSGRDGDIIVIVSHADTLQILQAYAAQLSNVGLFSQYRFGNGEVRALGRSPDTLPPPSPLAVPKPGEYAP